MAKAKRKNATRAAKSARALRRSATTLLSATAQFGTAQVSAETNLTVNASVMAPARTRHGLSRPRARQIAMLAIQALYPKGLPEIFNLAELTREANKWLKDHPEYHAAVVSKLSPKTRVHSANGYARGGRAAATALKTFTLVTVVTLDS
jgi:hypothetical protein